MKKQMDLRWAQQELDLWLELGVSADQLRDDIIDRRREEVFSLDAEIKLTPNDEIIGYAARIIRWSMALEELETYEKEGPGYTVSELLEGYVLKLGKLVAHDIQTTGAYKPEKYLEDQMLDYGTFPKQIVLDFLLNFYPDPAHEVYEVWMKNLYYGPCGKCYGRGGIVDWYDDEYGGRQAVIRECPRCGE